MAGKIKTLRFAEGVTVDAPDQGFALSAGWIGYTSDAAFVTAKGVAAANGDAYYNTTNKVVRFYQNGSWLTFGNGDENAKVLWNLTGAPGPLDSLVDGIQLYDFDKESLMEMYAFINVPSNYIPGNKIKLEKGVFYCSSVVGKVLFRCETTLMKNASSILGVYPNKRTSTNTELTVSLNSNEQTAIGDIQLTDDNGQINAVNVAPGDILRVRLYRDNTNESSPALDDARLLKDSLIVRFA